MGDDMVVTPIFYVQYQTGCFDKTEVTIKERF